MIIAVAATLGITNSGYSGDLTVQELLQGKREEIRQSGRQSLRVDGHQLSFDLPENFASTGLAADKVSVIETRSKVLEAWLLKTGRQPSLHCFVVGRKFYTLGIPVLGQSAQFSIGGVLHIELTRPLDYNPRPLVTHSGKILPPYEIPDYSNPEELLKKFEVARSGRAHTPPAEVTILSRGQMNFEQAYAATHFTPAEEVIINNRKWYRRLENSGLYPQSLKVRYVTGLAQDRYLELSVYYDPVPVYSDYYPRIPAEADQADWLKQSLQYANQVLSSIRLTPADPNAPPDRYEVPAPADAKAN